MTDPSSVPLLAAIGVLAANLAVVGAGLQIFRAVERARKRRRLRAVKAVLGKIQQMGRPNPR